MTHSGVRTDSFGGHPFPPEVVNQILNLLISGSPFANSLTRQPTSRSSIAWPTAKPVGWAWLAELAPFPVIDLDDSAYLAAIAKIGAIIDLANEAVTDTSINLTGNLETVLRDSLSRDLDLGLLNGAGPPEPVGVIGVAPAAEGADLLAAVAAAKGSIGDKGGTASALAISATALADADIERGSTGELVFPSGFAAATGLTPVVVPELADFLVYDQSRCYLAVRNDATVEASTDFHFDRDATSIRVKARIAAAVPDPPKSLRKLEISGANGRARQAPKGKAA